MAKVPHIKGGPHDEGRAGWCIHYSGMLNSKCNAGVNYEDVAVAVEFSFTRHSAPRTILRKGIAHPCFRREQSLADTCLQCRHPSAKEIEEMKEEDRKEAKDNEGIISLIEGEVRRGNPQRIHSGTIKCPECGLKNLCYGYHREHRNLTIACKTINCLNLHASGVEIS